MKPFYSQSGITIYHGDCREVIGQWEGLRTHSFDLLLTDPPYGIGIAANPVRQLHEKSDWDDEAPSPQTIARCMAVARKSILWGGNYFYLPRCQRFLIWDKEQPEDFSLAMCEMAWTNLSGPAKIFRKSVLSYRKDHPTEKPESLMAWCIRFADPAQTILDPFMGSGTTLVAAKRLGRQAVGIEREEKYCALAVSRLQQEALPLEVA
jgi:site-specific DNA-methyltransferase (adenine-specific)